jgi:hypothetical protein
LEEALQRNALKRAVQNHHQREQYTNTIDGKSTTFPLENAVQTHSQKVQYKLALEVAEHNHS